MKIISIAKKLMKEAAFKVVYDVGNKGYPATHKEKYMFLPTSGDVDKFVRHTETGNGIIKNLVIQEVSDAELPSEIKELRFKRLREQEEREKVEERKDRPRTPRTPGGPRTPTPRSKVTVYPKGTAPSMSASPAKVVNEQVAGDKLWKLEAAPSLSSKWELLGAWAKTRKEAEGAILDYLTQNGATDPLINTDFIKSHYYGESEDRIPQGGIGKQDTV